MKNFSSRCFPESFGELDSSKIGKYAISKRLLVGMLEAGIATFIVTASPRLRDYLTKSPCKIIQCKRTIIYGITKKADVDPAIKVLMSRRLWHFPAMHIFFASPEFLLKIQEFGTTSFKTMMEFEWSAKDEIYGAIDFVDDNLIFYAEMEFEKSLVKVFPEIDITE